MKAYYLELADKLNESAENLLVRNGRIWQHYKGSVYEVLGLCVDTDDGSFRVRYRRVDGPDFNSLGEQAVEFVRPLSEWFDLVETKAENPCAELVQRFIPVHQVKVWKAR